MTVMQDIRAALEQQIANVSGIPSTANRAWENVRFIPTTNTAWVRMALVPVTSRPAVLGPNPQIRHDGSFLVTAHLPEGAGPAAADALADAIRAAFTVDTGLTSGGVNVRFNYAERGVAVLDPPWYIVTVSIAWYSYSSS